MKKGFTPHHFHISNFIRVPLFKKSGGGFTLIEIIVAISIFLIGIVGVYAVVPRIIAIGQINVDRFVASQLGREGIEIVRNIRDANWLVRDDFDEGLTNGFWRVQYNKDFLLSLSDNPFLRISSQGFYDYDSETETKFKRKVTLSHPAADSLGVKIEISWPGRGSPFHLEEILYNWR